MNDKVEILLVEDDKSYAEMILMALQKPGRRDRGRTRGPFFRYGPRLPSRGVRKSLTHRPADCRNRLRGCRQLAGDKTPGA